MELLLNRFRNLTVLLIVVVAQLLLLAYQVRSSQDVRLIRVWSVTAVTPIAKVLEVVRRNTIGLVEDYFVLIRVREENRRLSNELGKMKMENHFLRSELQTAERAQALSAFQARTPSRTIPARVIGTGTGANSRVVYVDQGSGAGIMRGMAVVTPEGIVGKVLDSYPTASQVMLITDNGFAAGVISQKNRVHGTVRGQGQSKCIIDYVQNEERVEVGEMFYTAGDDRIFPKGMPVGRATVVRSGKTFKEIYIVPSGMQNGLEEVLIVVQGEHQAIPDYTATASGDIYMMDPPKDATPAAKLPDAVVTDADRMRNQYKQLGNAQGHTFGEGTPGSRPPNFNLRVETPKPAQPGQPASPTPTAPQQPGAPAVAGQPNPNATPPNATTPSYRPPTQLQPGAPVGQQATQPAQTNPTPGNPLAVSPPKPKPVAPKPAAQQPPPSTSRPSAIVTGPDGQPILIVPRGGTPQSVPNNQTNPSGPPPERPQPRVTTNESTINIVTPPPRSTTLPPYQPPAAAPKPAATKPKPTPPPPENTPNP